MANETDDRDEPLPNLPSDTLKSWNPDQSEILCSFDTRSRANDSALAGVPTPPDVGGLDETTVEVPAATEVPGDSQRSESAPNVTLRTKLGVGGFGEVWEAIQECLGRPVAIKMIRRDLCPTRNPSDARHIFIETNLRQEALTAASLDHPNIVPVYDLQDDERGFPALAMKLVRGSAWDEVIKADFPVMSPDEFLAKHVPVLIGVAQAVAFAHSRGIVHRDLKPSQVMVGEFGEVLLMDWGLGLVFDRETLQQSGQTSQPEDMATLQSASNPAGTMSYMAPEQTDSTMARIGPWTDVYLLGGTLYQLLTGVPPHHAATAALVFESAKSGTVVPPREQAPERAMPDELVELSTACLDPDPTARPQNGKEFLDWLVGYFSGASRRRQSRDLTEEAQALISKAAGDYAELTRCGALLGRAHDLWPGNTEAGRLSQRVFAEFSKSALAKGDLQLAKLQAGGLREGPDKQEILARVVDAERRVKLRERERRIAGAAVIAALVIIVAGTLYYNRRLNEAFRNAVQARSDAESLVAGLQDHLYGELAALGQVGVLDQFGTQVDSYFSTHNADAQSPESRVRHLKGLMAFQAAKSQSGHTTAAIELGTRAVKMAAQLEVSDPANSDNIALAAQAKCGLANELYLAGGRRENASALAREAKADFQRLASAAPASGDSQKDAADAAEILARMLFLLDGDTTAAGDLLATATAIRDKLLAARPNDADALNGKATNQLRAAQFYVGCGRLEEALKALSEARKIRDRIAAESAGNALNEVETARIVFWTGRANERLGNVATALSEHEAALRLRDELSARDPEDLTLRWTLAQSRAKVAELKLDAGDLAEAEKQLSSTLAVLDQIPAGASANHEYKLALGSARLVNGRIFEARGDMIQARREYGRAVGAFRQLEAFAPYEYFMLRHLDEALLRLDRRDEAEAVAAKLRKIGYKGAGLSRMLQEKGLQPL